MVTKREVVMINALWLAFAIVVFVVILIVVFIDHRRDMAAIKHREQGLFKLYDGAVARYIEAEEKLLEIYQTEGEGK